MGPSRFLLLRRLLGPVPETVRELISSFYTPALFRSPTLIRYSTFLGNQLKPLLVRLLRSGAPPSLRIGFPIGYPRSTAISTLSCSSPHILDLIFIAGKAYFGYQHVRLLLHWLSVGAQPCGIADELRKLLELCVVDVYMSSFPAVMLDL